MRRGGLKKKERKKNGAERNGDVRCLEIEKISENFEKKKTNL